MDLTVVHDKEDGTTGIRHQHLAEIKELLLPDPGLIHLEVQLPARADSGNHRNGTRLPGPGYHGRLPDRRPGGPGMIVGPDAGLICEEDRCTLLLGSRLDLREGLLLPFRDLFRILLVSPVKGTLRRHPQFPENVADADNRQANPELAEDQILYHPAGPQRQPERKLPGVITHYEPVELRHLPVVKLRLGPACLLRPQRLWPECTIRLLPLKYRRPGDLENFRYLVRRDTILQSLARGNAFLVCCPTTLYRHNENYIAEPTRSPETYCLIRSHPTGNRQAANCSTGRKNTTARSTRSAG